jgi:uncharacterized protein
MAISRTTISIPTASKDELEAWLYLPEGNRPHPTVIMAHGIGAIKACGLDPFAKRFCREGFAAVVFDYRNWGGSTGQPREHLSFARQLEDYGTVINWAASHPDIDEQRIFAWGTSFAGMYVVELAASNCRLAGVIGQVPLVDAVAAARMASPIQGLRLLVAALLDRIGSLVGIPPVYLRGAGRPGERAIGTTKDSFFGERLLTPKDSTEWRNRVTARSLLSFSWRRPVRRAAAIRCPLLFVVAEQDSMAPVGPAIRVTDNAPLGELYRSRGGHYDVYQGGKSFDEVLRVELEFLHRHARKPRNAITDICH